MIVTIQISNPAHMQPNQYGALVAHCMKMDRFHSIEVPASIEPNRPIKISFLFLGVPQLIDQAKITQQLTEEVQALSKLEPFPCPCGCGAFIAISPCFRQSGELSESIALNDEEKRLALSGNPIGAIKSLRDRYAQPSDRLILSLRDAKDLVDHFLGRARAGFDPTKVVLSYRAP